MDGYFHRMIWFREYPCVLTISFTFFDQIRLQTSGPHAKAPREATAFQLFT